MTNSLQPSAPGSNPAPSTAPAEGAPAGGGGGGGMFGGVGGMLFLLLPIALIFFMTRSQSKKQKDLESSLKVGDRVITRAGVLGKIVKLGDRSVELELAPGVFVSFLRNSIEGLDLGDPKKDEPKKDKDEKSKDEKSKDEKPKDEKPKDEKKGKA